MRQLINNNQMGVPCNGGIKIKFVKLKTAVLRFSGRNLLQSFQQGGRLWLIMCFNESDNYIRITLFGSMRCF